MQILSAKTTTQKSVVAVGGQPWDWQ